MSIPAELAHSVEEFYERHETMSAILWPMPCCEETPRVTASVKLRNNHGPDGTLGEPQEFVLLDGLYYRVAWIKSGQGLRREQLEFNPPDRAKGE